MAGKVKSVIILAGGLGTRIRSEIGDIPKCLAPVNNRPFIFYLLDQLLAANFERVILSVGYKAEIVEEAVGSSYEALQIRYIKEEVPLGTGGAIKKCLKNIEDESVLVINGDTFFDLPFDELTQFHQKTNASITLALRSLEDTGRFGKVQLDEYGKIIAFEEKKAGGPGYINGGIYCLERSILSKLPTAENFSFEKDFLAMLDTETELFGMVFDQYFIDIGIPADYQKFNAKHG